MKNITLIACKLFLFLFCFTSAIETWAQLPTCSGPNSGANLIYYLSGSIYNFDPTLPVSSTNPVTNSIPPPSSSIGLSLGKNLNAATPAVTFYACDGVSDYYYYNGTSWVNTGYTTGYSYAVNPGSSGNYIFNIDGVDGVVYRYDGTANGTSLGTVAGWSGSATGPYDVQGDCAGNYYLLNTGASPQWLREYNSSGTQINSWTLTGAQTTSAGGGEWQL